MSSGTKVIPAGGRPERMISLFGEVNPDSVLATMESLLSLGNEGEDPVVLHIMSPGGCVSSGLSLVDVMHHIRAPVFTVGSGTVASMGAVILVAGEPGYRYALPHTRIMLHAISGHTAGRLEEIQSATRLHRELDQEVEALLLARTKIPRNQLRRLLRKERFLSAQEARDLGLIDHIL